jgi:hypothetical protein
LAPGDIRRPPFWAAPLLAALNINQTVPHQLIVPRFPPQAPTLYAYDPGNGSGVSFQASRTTTELRGSEPGFDGAVCFAHRPGCVFPRFPVRPMLRKMNQQPNEEANRANDLPSFENRLHRGNGPINASADVRSLVTRPFCRQERERLHSRCGDHRQIEERKSRSLGG